MDTIHHPNQAIPNAQPDSQPAAFMDSLKQKIQSLWQKCKPFLIDAWKHASKFEIILFTASLLSIPVIIVFGQWELLPGVISAIVGTVINVLKKMHVTKVQEATMANLKDALLEKVRNSQNYDPALKIAEIKEEYQIVLAKASPEKKPALAALLNDIIQTDISLIELKTRLQVQGFGVLPSELENPVEANSDKENNQRFVLENSVNVFHQKCAAYREERNFVELRTQLSAFVADKKYPAARRHYFETMDQIVKDLIQKRENPAEREEDWLENIEFRINEAFVQRNTVPEAPEAPVKDENKLPNPAQARFPYHSLKA